MEIKIEITGLTQLAAQFMPAALATVAEIEAACNAQRWDILEAYTHPYRPPPGLDEAIEARRQDEEFQRRLQRLVEENQQVLERLAKS